MNLNLSSLEKTKAELEYYKRNGAFSTTSLFGDDAYDARAYATDRHHYSTSTAPL